MLPNFLCIGAQKAGTTWLQQRLIEHPSIWLPPVKEIHYFDHLFVPGNRGWTRWHIERGVEQSLRWHLQQSKKANLSYVRYLADMAGPDMFTEQWYRNMFNRPIAEGTVVGDITPEYCMIPEQGINYVRQILGSVKIIYIIREPVGRAISQIRMYFGRNSISSPTLEHWRAYLDDPEVFNRGDYATYIPRWQNAFAPSDILFLPFQKLASDPAGLLKEIENFLGVDSIDRNDKAIGEPVHASIPTAVPDAVRDELERRLADQTAFLASTFGPDFAA